ncbi:MAG: phenylacetate--CoA ligase family protein [Desulfomonilaceae bacterium]
MPFRLFNTYALYPLAEKVQHRRIRSKLRTLRSHAKRPFHQRKTWQLQRLGQVVQLAADSVPYYRELFEKTNFDPSKVERDPSYLRRLPYLTKDIIRREGTRLLSERFSQTVLHVRKTGGSTGPSTLIYYSQEALDWTAAVNLLVLEWAGKKRHWKEVHLSTRFPDSIPLKDRLKERIKCLALNRINILTDQLDDQGLAELWNELLRARPYLVQGHPSTMWALSRFVRKRGYDARGVLQVFESTGEALDPMKRFFIQDALNCRVINRYGNAEFGVIAYSPEPDEDSYLRLLDFMVWPEAEATEDGPPELIFTGLTNSAMPLIRYRTGDQGVLQEDSDGFLLRNLRGRVHELVRVGNRTYPTHYFQDLLDKIGGITEFQILDRNDGRPLFKIVPDEFDSGEAISTRVGQWLGNNVDVMLVDVEGLNRVGRNSKFCHVVRETSA